MSKVLEIDDCFDCKFCTSSYASPLYFCAHPSTPENGKQIEDVNHMPSWCPLPNKQEKGG